MKYKLIARAVLSYMIRMVMDGSYVFSIRHCQTGDAPVNLAEMVLLSRGPDADESRFLNACSSTGWLYSQSTRLNESEPMVANLRLPWPEEDVRDNVDDIDILSPLHLMVAAGFEGRGCVEACTSALRECFYRAYTSSATTAITSSFSLAATKGRSPHLLDGLWEAIEEGVAMNMLRLRKQFIAHDELPPVSTSVKNAKVFVFVDAATNAAARGHAHVVKHLLDRCSYSEIDLVEIFTAAFYNGEDAVVRMLLIEYGAFPLRPNAPCITKKLVSKYFWRDFAGTGHMNTLRTFMELRPGGIDKRSVCSHGHEEMLILLRLPVVARAPDVVDELLRALTNSPWHYTSASEEAEAELFRETVEDVATMAARCGAREVLDLVVRAWGARSRSCESCESCVSQDPPVMTTEYEKDMVEDFPLRWIRVRRYWGDDGRGGRVSLLSMTHRARHCK